LAPKNSRVRAEIQNLGRSLAGGGPAAGPSRSSGSRHPARTDDRRLLHERLAENAVRRPLPCAGPDRSWHVDSTTARFIWRGPSFRRASWPMLKPIVVPWSVITGASSSGPSSRLSGPNRFVITATRSGHENQLRAFGDYLSSAIADRGRPRQDSSYRCSKPGCWPRRESASSTPRGSPGERSIAHRLHLRPPWPPPTGSGGCVIRRRNGARPDGVRSGHGISSPAARITTACLKSARRPRPLEQSWLTCAIASQLARRIFALLEPAAGGLSRLS